MIGKEIAKAIVDQIGVEFTNSQAYYVLSAWFALRGMDEWAKIMHDSGDDERSHAQKFIGFLSDCNVKYDMPSMPEFKMPNFDKPEQIIDQALKLEQATTIKIKNLMKAAKDLGEYPVESLLYWFVDEQVSSEAEVRNWLDLLKAGTPPYLAEPQLTLA